MLKDSFDIFIQRFNVFWYNITLFYELPLKAVRHHFTKPTLLNSITNEVAIFADNHAHRVTQDW